MNTNTNNNAADEMAALVLTRKWEQMDRTYRMLQDDLHYYESVGNDEAADEAWRLMQEMTPELNALDTMMAELQNS